MRAAKVGNVLNRIGLVGAKLVMVMVLVLPRAPVTDTTWPDVATLLCAYARSYKTHGSIVPRAAIGYQLPPRLVM